VTVTQESATVLMEKQGYVCRWRSRDMCADGEGGISPPLFLFLFLFFQVRGQMDRIHALSSEREELRVDTERERAEKASLQAALTEEYRYTILCICVYL
jgi:hypothetical protein